MESQFEDDIKIKSIIKNTSLYFGVKPEYVFRNTRKRGSVVPRQIIHYLCKIQTKKTYEKIGSISLDYGRDKKHDHASVLNSCKVVKSLIFSDKEFNKDVEKIKSMCLKDIDNTEIKSDFKIQDYTEINLRLEEIIVLKDKKILELELKLKEKNPVKNNYLCELLDKDDYIIKQFCETRLKPYLKMLENRVTRQDLIDFQHQTRTQFNF